MRFVSLCLILCFLCLVPCAPARAAEGEAQAEAANAVNAFAFDVYRLLSKEKGNLFFSPYSISSALAMTWAGARGDTAAEMEKALRFGAESKSESTSESESESETNSIHAGMKELRERFASMPEDLGVLAVANRLWLDGREKLLPDFAALVGQNYGAAAEPVDFEKDAEAARAAINDWVEQQTRGKIVNLLRGGDVTPDTRLVLTNAVYFNSAWRRPFPKSATKDEPFRTGKADAGQAEKYEQKNVPMMKLTGNFLYGENDALQLIKVPYKMPGFSLLILLPRENDSFTQLEELEPKLTPEALARWTAGMKDSVTELHLPKFKDERRYALGEILQQLGMNLAFTGEADFSAMMRGARGGENGEGNVHINAVIHQTFIELDEEKTEAAAATAVTMMRTSAVLRQPEHVFRADRPFIYCITDDASGTVLFMGRMAAP